jgi:hypothetical protein
MKPQFIKTPEGEDAVILGRNDYDELIRIAEEAEDAADVAIYDERKADPLGSQPLPADLSQLILRGNGLLKSLRLWRNLGQVELAEATGTSQGFISDLETNRRKVTGDMARKLAKALDVPEHWLP